MRVRWGGEGQQISSELGRTNMEGEGGDEEGGRWGEEVKRE
jgi:hypothetical protein